MGMQSLLGDERRSVSKLIKVDLSDIPHTGTPAHVEQDQPMLGEKAMTIVQIGINRFRGSKQSYTARRIPREVMADLTDTTVTPKAGDLVLARIVEIGQHKNLQLGDGRRSRLFTGDEVLVCYGNRYAPDQFEAYVPEDLAPCQLVAGGGIAAQVSSSSTRMAEATSIEPLGLVTDKEGKVLNLADYALPSVPDPIADRPIIAVAGTAMNAGKTETVINLVKGLVRGGMNVGVAKVTGTGAGGDVWAAVDAGASPVLDFTDAGLPSTFNMPAECIEQNAINLVAHLLRSRADAIVIEIADGLYQEDTAALLSSSRFTDLLNGLIFAAGDAMGAAAGLSWLQTRELPVLGLSGAMTASPLAIRESLAVTGKNVWDMATLSDPAFAQALIDPFTVAPLASEAG